MINRCLPQLVWEIIHDHNKSRMTKKFHLLLFNFLVPWLFQPGIKTFLVVFALPFNAHPYSKIHIWQFYFISHCLVIIYSIRPILCHAEFISIKMKIYLHFLSLFKTKVAQIAKSFVMKTDDPVVLHLMYPRYRFYYRGLTLIPAWISYFITGQMWDEFIYPLEEVNGCIIDVREWISNLIQHFTMGVIICTCGN